MNRSRLLGAVCAVVISFISIPSQAALISALNGQAVYDDDRDISWLADANLALTNQFGLTLSTDEIDRTANTVGSTGKMTWYNAHAWIAGMNAFNGGNGYLGFNDWRLPITPQPDTSCSNQFDEGEGFPLQGYGFDCTGSEMGHLYNDEGVTTATPDMFNNVQSYGSWSSTPFAEGSTNAWHFTFLNGYQSWDVKDDIYYAWAVHDGDIGAIPIPPALWLFGSGLLCLVGFGTRKAQ